jgi:hypothetical protein
VAGPGPNEQPHTGTLSSTFDFSASAFEFSQVTSDTTDRLTHQHEPHDTNGFNSALSPGTTSYLDTLQLQYPTSHTGGHPDNHEVHTFDIVSHFEQAFQDDGSKRRRVSPDSDLDHAVTSSSSASIASSLLSASASSSDQTDTTSFGSHSPVFDPFHPYFPYTFAFTPTPSGWAPPNLTYPLVEEETNDLLVGRPDSTFQPGSMDDTTLL